jgi:chemotaxis protein CheC
VSATYNDLQLDLLRELANIGAGNASTALSGMLDSSMIVEGEGCSIVFLLSPDHGRAGELLSRLGVL